MGENILHTENQRLKFLQSELGFKSQSSFAEKLGIKQGSLSDIYREKAGVKVSSSIKRILEKEFSINIDWLESGQGDIIKSSPQDDIQNFIQDNLLTSKKDDIMTIFNRLLDVIERRDAAIELMGTEIKNQREQMDRLITMLEHDKGMDEASPKKRTAI